MTHPPAGPVTPTPPPGPKQGATLLLTLPNPHGPQPPPDPTNPAPSRPHGVRSPAWAVACLIAAAVLTAAALALWDIVTVLLAVVGGR